MKETSAEHHTMRCGDDDRVYKSMFTLFQTIVISDDEVGVFGDAVCGDGREFGSWELGACPNRISLR